MVIDSVTVPKERKQEAKMQSQSQNVKKVAGLDQYRQFVRSDKNADQFKSNRMKTVYERLQQEEWCTFDGLQAEVVSELNKDFEPDDNPIYLTRTQQYLKLVCKYSKCPFDNWFVMDEPGTKFKLYRKIN